MTFITVLASWLPGLSFHRPWCLLLLPLPWLVYRLIPMARPVQQAILVPFYADLPLESTRAAPRPAVSGRWLLTTVIWLLLMTAAAAPCHLGPPAQLPMTGRDTLLAVDLSDSMATEDMLFQGRRINRLETIKRVASRFIDNRKGDRVGLILFGTQAYLQTPLTLDTATVHTLLDEASVGIAGPQTAIGDAIGLAVRQLRKRPAGHRVLILLTDGANTAGNLSPLQATELAASAGVTIYTLGVGADTQALPPPAGYRGQSSADLDEDTLIRIAALTGGRYFRARSTRDLTEIYQTLDTMEPIELGKDMLRPSQQLFHWPLALAFFLSGLLALHCMAVQAMRP
ncbi:MAG: VWA domain-containing protein [Kistimonas sp.]|nr:VWA domain-containing protein [Kistimonas sp.]